eukprot:4472346-Prymnesium_polylepis.1
MHDTHQLHRAAARGEPAPIRRLLSAMPALVHVCDPHGATPLHVACRHGHAGAVELLLHAGAAADARDGAGATALDVAAEWRHAACVAALRAWARRRPYVEPRPRAIAAACDTLSRAPAPQPQLVTREKSTCVLRVYGVSG